RVRLQAHVEDGSATVETLTFEFAAPGGPWETIGTCDAAPWEAGWDVDALPAGEVMLRVRSVDTRGHEQSSSPVPVRVVSPPPAVELQPLPSQLRDRIELGAKVDRPGRVELVEFQLIEDDADNWLTVASCG